MKAATVRTQWILSYPSPERAINEPRDETPEDHAHRGAQRTVFSAARDPIYPFAAKRTSTIRSDAIFSRSARIVAASTPGGNDTVARA
jgi:hypothetical protein